MKSKIVFFVGVLILAGTPALADFGLKPDGHLDITALRETFRQNGFARVQAALEGFLKKHPKEVTLEEKTFTHMYLGALYSADAGSRVKAESHFNAMFRLAPATESLEMAVAPETLEAFERIKRIHRPAREPETESVSSAKPSRTIPVESAGKKEAAVSDGGGKGWVWWTVGSAAIVAAGVGYYAVNESGEKPSPRRTEVDGTIK